MLFRSTVLRLHKQELHGLPTRLLLRRQKRYSLQSLRPRILSIAVLHIHEGHGMHRMPSGLLLPRGGYDSMPTGFILPTLRERRNPLSTGYISQRHAGHFVNIVYPMPRKHLRQPQRFHILHGLRTMRSDGTIQIWVWWK